METPVTATIWAITAGVALLVIGADLAWAFARRNRMTTVRESVAWTLFYIASAVAFGFFLMAWQNPIVSEEYFATWVTQYPLSIDNLFVFIVIMGSFAVPTLYQQKILQIGILGALILRFAFILVGAALLNAFWWMFFVFGAFLIYTAYKLATTHEGDTDPTKGRLIQSLQKFLPMTPTYHEGKYSIKISGRRVFTPLLPVS